LQGKVKPAYPLFLRGDSMVEMDEEDEVEEMVEEEGKKSYVVFVNRGGLVPQNIKIQASSSQEAIESAKQKLDPSRRYPNWRYTATLVKNR